ncbi:MAG: MBL fold metallo-hydrolase [Thermoleophilia bacterium]|nr:MBL fold metallo-hydrolase [Thermoleophilia bacterium]MDQ3858382.1 MBL fold metallo-hydrolase [Actinomycetota bacterium]
MEIAPGVHVLGGKKGGRVRAFLLEGGNGLTLVDTLFETDARGVLEGLRGLGRRASDLKQIVVTHAHRSHLGGVAALKTASGATVYAHEWEADIVSGDRRAQAVTLLPRQTLRLWPFQLGLAVGRPKHPPCPVDRHVEDEEEIGPLRVLHAPGHSPGHLAFHWPERRLLIAGDAISTWPDFRAGWDAFNLNPKQHRASLARMAELDAELVGVGHGDPIVRGGGERVRELAERGR